MISTKPDLILKNLSQPELNRLDNHITYSSKGFDSNLLLLWNYIRPFYKERISEAIDKKKCWKQVFGNKKYVDLRYARLLSDFTKQLESFLLSEYFQKNETIRNTSLLEIYNNRSLSSCFSPLLKHTKQQHEKMPYRDENYFLTQFKIDVLESNFIESKDSREDKNHLAQTLHNLDIVYVLQKLKYSAMVLHYQKIMPLDISLNFLEDVLVYAQSKAFADISIIQIFVSIVHTLQEKKGDTHYQKLYHLLKTNTQFFAKEELENIYAYAVNYCIRQINKGNLDYQQKIFLLYKQMLEDGTLTHRKILSPWEFKNIVTISLRVKEYAWAIHFIETYAAFIPKKERENALTFNRARYYFAIKKYDQVLLLLNTVEYDDVFYQLDAKTTLMKTYFELGEYQPLLSLKESFRILLSRKKAISDTQRILYGNFIKLCLKLFRIDVKDKSKIAALQNEIARSSNVADLGWLKEKLIQLID